MMHCLITFYLSNAIYNGFCSYLFAYKSGLHLTWWQAKFISSNQYYLDQLL